MSEIDNTTTPNVTVVENKPNRMTEEKVNKLALQAVEDIQRANGRLQELQDYCSHKETKVELVQQALRTTCVCCYKVVGYPTPEESKKAGYV